MRTKTSGFGRRCSSRALRWSQPVAAATTRARRAPAQQPGEGGTPAANQVITVNWGTEPPSLDTGLATDTTSSNILLNIMDPLVKRRGSPACRERGRELQDERRRQDRHVRAEGRREVDERRPRHRARTSSTRGSARCLRNSGPTTRTSSTASSGRRSTTAAIRRRTMRRARRQGGSERRRDKTLEVKLTSPQPWFIQQSAHTSFLAVPPRRPWRSSATSGPSQRTSSPTAPSSSRSGSTTPASTSSSGTDGATLTRVKLTRVKRPHDHRRHDGRSGVRGRRDRRPVSEPAAGRDFAAEGAQGGTPGARLWAPTTTGSTSEDISDVKQRRAMSLAIDRRSMIDNIAQQATADHRLHPRRACRASTCFNPEWPWQPEDG